MSIFDFKRAKENEMLKEIFEEISEEDFFIKEGLLEIEKNRLLRVLRETGKYEVYITPLKITNKVAIVKATLKVNGRVCEGIGAAERKEIDLMQGPHVFRTKSNMVATAETRAIKEALEWILGTEIINIKAREIQNKITETGQNAKVNNTPPTYQNSKHNIQNNTQNTSYNKV
ncbi:MAG: hypothetical protein N3D81_02710 [Spirochaetes bacterium]|nr:hypothetical protein [Candidatus Calescibacterium sp.]MCX8096393.1 hypothetical protein [Spirochaetota bacterium]